LPVLGEFFWALLVFARPIRGERTGEGRLHLDSERERRV
jgi:hypothetical protein